MFCVTLSAGFALIRYSRGLEIQLCATSADGFVHGRRFILQMYILISALFQPSKSEIIEEEEEEEV